MASNPDPLLAGALSLGWAVLPALAVFTAIGIGVVLAIFHAAKYPRPTMLIAVMSLMTLVFLGGYLFVGAQSTAGQVFSNLMSVSLGALSTAAAYEFGGRKRASDDEDSAEPPAE